MQEVTFHEFIYFNQYIVSFFNEILSTVQLLPSPSAFLQSKYFLNFSFNFEIEVDVSLTVMSVLAKFQATLAW